MQMQLYLFLGHIVHCKAMLKSQEKLSANESAKNCRILPDRKKNVIHSQKFKLFVWTLNANIGLFYLFSKLKTKPNYIHEI